MYVLALMGALAVAQDAPASPAEAPSKLSFDERVVRGQVAAGSVYLFQRKPRALPGLVPVRRSYRAEIVAPVLGSRASRSASNR